MTTNFLRIIAAAAVLVTGNASADAIYRCQKGGHVSYSDVPCAEPPPEAASSELPPLVPMAATTKGEQSLANQFDRAASTAAVQLHRDNDAWLREYQVKKAREEAIRKGVVEGHVVEGMSRDQVEHILNLPTRIEDQDGPHEKWIYAGSGGHKRTITFDNGFVVSDKKHSKKSG